MSPIQRLEGIRDGNNNGGEHNPCADEHTPDHRESIIHVLMKLCSMLCAKHRIGEIKMKREDAHFDTFVGITTPL